MPRPDTSLASAAANRDLAPPVRSRRDPRIDLFRGIALTMIFIDHMPGNPYEHWTSRNFGFSDAAEAFFVMSGIAAGLAYSARFEDEALRRNGLWPAMRPIWGRAWTLYIVQVFLSLWAVAIFAWGAATFLLPELLEKNNLAPIFEKTPEALAGLAALTHQIGYVNILPAYTVLLLVAPAIIWAGLRWPVAVACASALLWYAAGLWRLNLPNYPNAGGWFFNPVAWQAVFVAGLLTGIAMKRGQRFVPYHPALFWLSAGIVALVLAWMHVPGFGPWLNRGMAWLGSQGAPFHIVSHDKTFLSAPRLIHILALFYLLSCLPSLRGFAGSRFGAPFRLLGRNGLLVFSSGTLLALLGQVILASEPQAAWPALLLPPAGVAAMLAIAWLKEAASGRRTPPAPAHPAAPARAEPQPRRAWSVPQVQPAE